MNVYVPTFQEYAKNVQLELEQLVDRAGTLALTLGDVNGRHIVLMFDSYMAYRKLDEGDALLTLSAMGKSGGTGKYFYRVDNSDFYAWFNAERCDTGHGQPLVHYVVAAINDIVDVLSLEPPTIKVS